MNAPAQVPEANARFHYMDNLRALAMLTGVVFHAALAYSVLAHPLWPTADRGQSLEEIRLSLTQPANKKSV